MEEWEKDWECCDMMSSGHNVATHSCPPSCHGCLHKIQPFKLPMWVEGVAHETLSRAEELLAVDSGWGRKSHFSL